MVHETVVNSTNVSAQNLTLKGVDENNPVSSKLLTLLSGFLGLFVTLLTEPTPAFDYAFSVALSPVAGILSKFRFL